MARYSYSWTGVTATVVADTAAYTNSGYPGFLQGGSGTMVLRIKEIEISGEDTASLACRMLFARDSTVASASIAGGFNAALDGSAVAPGTLATVGNSSSTKPQRSSTLHLLNCGLNTWGGLFLYRPLSADEEITIVGNTASLGEASLSSAAGAGITSGHIIYELK